MRYYYKLRGDQLKKYLSSWSLELFVRQVLNSRYRLDDANYEVRFTKSYKSLWGAFIAQEEKVYGVGENAKKLKKYQFQLHAFSFSHANVLFRPVPAAGKTSAYYVINDSIMAIVSSNLGCFQGKGDSLLSFGISKHAELEPLDLNNNLYLFNDNFFPEFLV